MPHTEKKEKKKKPSTNTPLIERGAMPVVILTLICTICVALLALTANVTADARAKQQQWLEDKNKRLIFPESDTFPAESLDSVGAGLPKAQAVDFTQQHPAVNQVFAAKRGDDVTGVIIQASSKGYGGSVPVMVGFTENGLIVGVVVDASTETAGLGQRVAESKFTDQFKGLSVNDTLDGVETISSATISSQSVIASVRTACDAWRSILGKEAN
ncbi:MAG: FMN-binding protein [Saccharofermentanales bacterium]|nr:FMN-binding protein [Clostridiaceae bacterium]